MNQQSLPRGIDNMLPSTEVLQLPEGDSRIYALPSGPRLLVASQSEWRTFTAQRCHRRSTCLDTPTKAKSHFFSDFGGNSQSVQRLRS